MRLISKIVFLIIILIAIILYIVGENHKSGKSPDSDLNNKLLTHYLKDDNIYMKFGISDSSSGNIRWESKEHRVTDRISSEPSLAYFGNRDIAVCYKTPLNGTDMLMIKVGHISGDSRISWSNDRQIIEGRNPAVTYLDENLSAVVYTDSDRGLRMVLMDMKRPNMSETYSFYFQEKIADYNAENHSVAYLGDEMIAVGWFDQSSSKYHFKCGIVDRKNKIVKWTDEEILNIKPKIGSPLFSPSLTYAGNDKIVMQYEDLADSERIALTFSIDRKTNSISLEKTEKTPIDSPGYSKDRKRLTLLGKFRTFSSMFSSIDASGTPLPDNYIEVVSDHDINNKSGNSSSNTVPLNLHDELY